MLLMLLGGILLLLFSKILANDVDDVGRDLAVVVNAVCWVLAVVVVVVDQKPCCCC